MREIGINLSARRDMDIPTFCAFIRELGFTRVFSGIKHPENLRAAAAIHRLRDAVDGAVE